VRFDAEGIRLPGVPLVAQPLVAAVSGAPDGDKASAAQSAGAAR